MVVNGWVIGSLALVLVIIGTALVRQRSIPPPQSTAELAHQVELLQREVEELRTQTARQEATIETLQSLLVNRQAEIDRLNTRMWQLERSQPAPAVPAALPASQRPLLLVVIGDDQALAVDVAMLRARRLTDRLRLAQLNNPPRPVLADTLQRYRSRGTPVPFVHFAVRSDERGLVLAGELVDGVWLSEVLAGVDVVMLAGCSTAAVGNLLRVAPVVVSLTKEVSNAEASEFAAAFWYQVAAGKDADEAFYEAVERVPAVGAFAELHG